MIEFWVKNVFIKVIYNSISAWTWTELCQFMMKDFHVVMSSYFVKIEFKYNA